MIQDNHTMKPDVLKLWSRVSRLPCGGLILNTVFDLNLINGIVAENSTGYGLLGFNLLGNPLITDSVLKHNRANQDCIGGFVMVFAPKLGTLTLLTIYSSQFLFGRQFHALWALEG